MLFGAIYISLTPIFRVCIFVWRTQGKFRRITLGIPMCKSTFNFAFVYSGLYDIPYRVDTFVFCWHGSVWIPFSSYVLVLLADFLLCFDWIGQTYSDSCFVLYPFCGKVICMRRCIVPCSVSRFCSWTVGCWPLLTFVGVLSTALWLFLFLP